MRMNTAIQCIILLACIAICSSASIIRCQCVKTSKIIHHSRIVDATVYNPRPYCNKKEVIVKLDDDGLRCLDPDTKFTEEILKMLKKRKAAQAKMITTGLKTTTASKPTST